MKKTILLMLMIIIASPLAAQEKDWKEKIMNDFVIIVESIDEGNLQGPQLVIRQQISTIFWQTMHGFNSSFATGVGAPTPDSVIQESVKIHNELLKGRIPNNEDLRNFGFKSLSHMESKMLEQGITQEQIQNQFSQPLQQILQQSKLLIGEIPKQ